MAPSCKLILVMQWKLCLVTFLLVLFRTQGISHENKDNLLDVNSLDPTVDHAVCGEDCQYDESIVVDDNIHVVDSDFTTGDTDSDFTTGDTDSDFTAGDTDSDFTAGDTDSDFTTGDTDSDFTAGDTDSDFTTGDTDIELIDTSVTVNGIDDDSVDVVMTARDAESDTIDTNDEDVTSEDMRGEFVEHIDSDVIIGDTQSLVIDNIDDTKDDTTDVTIEYIDGIVIDKVDTADTVSMDLTSSDTNGEKDTVSVTDEKGCTQKEEGSSKEGDSENENNDGVFLEPCQNNATVKNETCHHDNQTEGCTPKPKYTCTSIELQENETVAVRLVNDTDLYQLLNRTNSTEGPCSIVLFYAPWCRFSANVAPHINALGRAYPTLHVLAVDAIQFSSLNARFGTVAVPNVLLFHNGKPVARFNQSERTFEHFKDFIKNHTGIEADPSVEVSEMDYIGPLPTKPTEEPDYFLWFSIIFLFCFSCHIFKQKFGDRIMERMRTWAEIHEHMD